MREKAVETKLIKGEALPTASGRNLGRAEVSRNKRSPRGGVAPIEAADVRHMRERDVERKLVRMVRDHGGLALKLISPGFNGVPDRLLLFPGRANLLRPPVADASSGWGSERPEKEPVAPFQRRTGGSPGQPAETSDLHGCAVAPIEAAGRVAFVEVKAPGQKPRPLQVHRMEQLRKLGFKVFVVDSISAINLLLSEMAEGGLEGDRKALQEGEKG